MERAYGNVKRYPVVPIKETGLRTWRCESCQHVFRHAQEQWECPECGEETVHFAPRAVLA